MNGNLDIFSILEGWDFVPGEVTVRRVRGLDGREKVQMRMDLGILQMEMDGRPDGHRPYGFESLLEYHQGRLEKYRGDHGDDIGFHLEVDDCADLRDESVQYYRRYLSLFHLGDYDRVVRDTERNLAVLDFIREYGSKDWEPIDLEQYRPYIMMMRVRARACVLLDQGRHREALDAITETVEGIRLFFDSLGQSSLFPECGEVIYLRELADEIVKKLPRDPVEDLRKQMNQAVKDEQYERAASLRDRIRRLLASRD